MVDSYLIWPVQVFKKRKKPRWVSVSQYNREHNGGICGSQTVLAF